MLEDVRFLFATDGSAGAQTAQAFLLALPLSRADRVTILTCSAHTFFGVDSVDASIAARARVEAERGAERIVADALAACSARDVPANVVVRDGPVAHAAQILAIEEASDLIVVGSRGLGALAGVLMGSVARALARHAPTPVLVVRERGSAPERIVAAVDGSEDARAAIRLLRRMPLPSAARVTLLHVLPARPANGAVSEEVVQALREAEERAGARVLREAAELLGDRVVDHQIAERGHVAQQILSRAMVASADLIVLGSRGLTLGTGFLQGSVADQVLSGAHCAVLVAKGGLATRTVGDRVAEARAPAVLAT